MIMRSRYFIFNKEPHAIFIFHLKFKYQNKNVVMKLAL